MLDSKVFLSFLIFLIFSTGCNRDKQHIKPTNIIIISIDTLRADHLGCYAYQRPTSPVIDEIASQGVLFEDVTAPSPWTLPSHASLLTGMYPSSNGVILLTNRLGNNTLTLAKLLSQHDFQTAAVVNSHWLSKKNGLHQGFRDFTYVKESATQAKPSKVTDNAMKWLSKNSENKFFLFLHYYDVHSDYISLPKYEKQFVRPYKGVADGTTEQLLAHRRGLIRFLPADVDHLIDLYDAGILQMNDDILRLIDFLKEKGLYEKSVIIITADHGEEFLEHGHVLHGRTVYQESVRVPLIFRGPGLPKGRRISQNASLVDIMPTILSLVDIPRPKGVDGIDLSQLWSNAEARIPQRYLFIEADWNNFIPNRVSTKISSNIKNADLNLRPMREESNVGNVIVDDIKRGVRHGKFKLCYDRLTKQIQLHDLQNDPNEKIDVSSMNRPLVDAMFSQLEKFMRFETTTKASEPLSQEEIKRLKSLGYLQ